ncbi:MAG: DciA family protein [Phycisphaerales bacterium]
MTNKPTLAGLEKVRGYRVRKVDMRPLTADFVRMQRDTERNGRMLGDVVEAWETMLPAELCNRTAIDSFGRGVLHVRADSAATRFELDRLLRTGIERAIRECCSRPLNRIKITIGAV